MTLFFIVGFVILAASLWWYFLIYLPKKPKGEKIDEMPESWKKLLTENVNFYRNLSQEDKIKFENRLLHFISIKRIIGVDTEVEDLDKVLIASSAVIPLFGFSEWTYPNLKEVLLYPKAFDKDFQISGTRKNITGMVGNGVMEGKMILSQKALRAGFIIDNDKSNVGIHEFIHLIDKADGEIDGVPKMLIQNQYAIPWLKIMHDEMNRIYSNQSDINPYGGTNQQEFLSVISEYFFERPDLLKRKHPKLYEAMENIFKQDLYDNLKVNKKRDFNN
ncbi:M90 family metallopeptidase [Aureibacter tunicatorum]|uniref:Peptidase n=1 Tax=Aureibacter tunicatorum TaxID=866807 RepID=A0AAE3XT70_9BACT|nr:zinc-dependent peptidase [Aureibacter tunicatorum]MDR6241643.1 hypothetical protein [Aureibacter tunicatorum]